MATGRQQCCGDQRAREKETMGNELPEEAAADARKTSDRVGGGIVFVSGLGFLAIGLFAWPSAPSDAISAPSSFPWLYALGGFVIGGGLGLVLCVVVRTTVTRVWMSAHAHRARRRQEALSLEATGMGAGVGLASHASQGHKHLAGIPAVAFDAIEVHVHESPGQTQLPGGVNKVPGPCRHAPIESEGLAGQACVREGTAETA
jgi:hypothetical protein